MNWLLIFLAVLLCLLAYQVAGAVGLLVVLVLILFFGGAARGL